MTAQAAHRLTEALHDWGCQTRAWEPDGRAWWAHTTPGDWHPEGVMHHHTASGRNVLDNPGAQEATVSLLRRGRPGLPGPLCHLEPSMAGGTGQARIWLVGWGNVNHAGLGSSRVLDQVQHARFDGPGGDGDTDGNPWFWGLEYLHPGDRTAWPDPLLEAGHRAACAIGEFTGWAKSSWPGRNVEHREWTRRKVDRSWRGNLRRAVLTVIERGADVALTDADVDRIAAAVWRGLKIGSVDQATPSARLVHVVRQVDAQAAELAAVKTELAALRAAQDGGVSEDVTAAFDAGLARISEVMSRVRVTTEPDA